MALIPCHECRAQISDSAPNCPHCGAANKNMNQVRVVMIVCVLTLALVGFCLNASA
jgi:hypothetical protein